MSASLNSLGLGSSQHKVESGINNTGSPKMQNFNGGQPLVNPTSRNIQDVAKEVS